MRKLACLALAFLAACGGSRPSTSTARPVAAGARGAAVVTGKPVIPEGWPLAGKAMAVTGTRAMVVSGHPLASAVGRDIMKEGGNAIDAAVAVAFALEVVLPEAGNIGGGGFIVYRDSTGQVRALDYREEAPGGATRDMYLDSAGNPTEKSITGHLSVGVPGSVA
ncbi:MAG TPA: gamma-glutamyltransferase, partial [Gemmatimonadales bacterium]